MGNIYEQKCPQCGGTLIYRPEKNAMVCEFCYSVLPIEETEAGTDDTSGIADTFGTDDTTATASTSANANALLNDAAQYSSSGSGAGPASFSANGSTAAAAKNAAAKNTAEKNTAEKPAQAAASDKKETLEGFNFEDYLGKAMDLDAEALPIYNCRSCGAELIADAQAISLKCPYCRNNIVLTDKVSGSLRPDGVIPFKITQKILPDAMKDFYKDKKILPRNFFSASKMGDITGVYVPFWIFSTDLSGRLYYNAEKNGGSSRSGDYLYTTTDIYQAARDVSVSFSNLPVDASGRIDDALMDSIEPFDMSEIKPFNAGYLAGYTAERFDVAADDMAARAETRMMNTAYSYARAYASQGEGYSSVKKTSGTLKAAFREVRYVLLPVYLFDISYGGKKYHFSVNAQSGKVVGEVPTGRFESFKCFMAGVLIAAAIGMLIMVILYFMGV